MGAVYQSGSMHSWRWEVICEKGLNTRNDSRRCLEA